MTLGNLFGGHEVPSMSGSGTQPANVHNTDRGGMDWSSGGGGGSGGWMPAGGGSGGWMPAGGGGGWMPAGGGGGWMPAGGGGSWMPAGKGKGKGDPSIALSALTLLAFLFFLNILQNCLQDSMTMQTTTPATVMMMAAQPTGGRASDRVRRSSNRELRGDVADYYEKAHNATLRDSRDLNETETELAHPITQSNDQVDGEVYIEKPLTNRDESQVITTTEKSTVTISTNDDNENSATDHGYVTTGEGYPANYQFEENSSIYNIDHITSADNVHQFIEDIITNEVDISPLKEERKQMDESNLLVHNRCDDISVCENEKETQSVARGSIWQDIALGGFEDISCHGLLVCEAYRLGERWGPTGLWIASGFSEMLLWLSEKSNRRMLEEAAEDACSSSGCSEHIQSCGESTGGRSLLPLLAALVDKFL